MAKYMYFYRTYSGKIDVSNSECGWIKILAQKVLQMNRSAKRVLIVTTNLDGFSLANC